MGLWDSIEKEKTRLEVTHYDNSSIFLAGYWSNGVQILEILVKKKFTTFNRCIFEVASIDTLMGTIMFSPKEFPMLTYLLVNDFWAFKFLLLHLSCLKNVTFVYVGQILNELFYNIYLVMNFTSFLCLLRCYVRRSSLNCLECACFVRS